MSATMAIADMLSGLGVSANIGEYLNARGLQTSADLALLFTDRPT